MITVTQTLTHRQMFIVSHALKLAMRNVKQEGGINDAVDATDKPVTMEEIQRLINLVDYRS